MEQELLTLPEHLSLLCVPRENAANTNFIIFGLIRIGLETTIYHTQVESVDHYTKEVMQDSITFCQI
jgi:hypothetical protein